MSIRQRRPLGYPNRTPFEVEDPFALHTPEVMVMPSPLRLVTRLFAGQLDDDYASLLAQHLDAPIDRRDAQTGDFAPRPIMDLRHRKRPVGIQNHPENGVPLSGFPPGTHALSIVARSILSRMPCQSMRRAREVSPSLHGVVTAFGKRLAAHDTPYSHQGTFENAMFPDRLDGVVRTGRREPARRRKERRNEPLIKSYRLYEDAAYQTDTLSRKRSQFEASSPVVVPSGFGPSF